MYDEILPAIYENLSDMYNDLDRGQESVMYTDEPANTDLIRGKLQGLIISAVNHLLNRSMINLEYTLDSMELLCEEGLDLTGCRIGLTGITGPYAVRLGTIKTIRAMMACQLPVSLPTYNDPIAYSFLHDYSDTKMIVDIRTIDFTKYHVVFHLTPRFTCLDDTICNHVKWEDCISYERLLKGEKPYCLQFEEYKPE